MSLPRVRPFPTQAPFRSAGRSCRNTRATRAPARRCRRRAIQPQPECASPGDAREQARDQEDRRRKVGDAYEADIRDLESRERQERKEAIALFEAYLARYRRWQRMKRGRR